jgi:ketopantoate hydroxymethyltransferase
VGKAIEKAISAYATEVRTRNFPAPANTYEVKD